MLFCQNCEVVLFNFGVIMKSMLTNMWPILLYLIYDCCSVICLFNGLAVDLYKIYYICKEFHKLQFSCLQFYHTVLLREMCPSCLICERSESLGIKVMKRLQVIIDTLTLFCPSSLKYFSVETFEKLFVLEISFVIWFFFGKMRFTSN